MKITTVLFDLDGTLLPMDPTVFAKAYFGSLARRLAPHGYEAEKLIDSIWKGTAAMVKNDGTTTNEERFWQSFEITYGKDGRQDEAAQHQTQPGEQIHFPGRGDNAQRANQTAGTHARRNAFVHHAEHAGGKRADDGRGKDGGQPNHRPLHDVAHLQHGSA